MGTMGTRGALSPIHSPTMNAVNLQPALPCPGVLTLALWAQLQRQQSEALAEKESELKAAMEQQQVQGVGALWRAIGGQHWGAPLGGSIGPSDALMPPCLPLPPRDSSP